jgi:hypothetical protein
LEILGASEHEIHVLQHLRIFPRVHTLGNLLHGILDGITNGLPAAQRRPGHMLEATEISVSKL